MATPKTKDADKVYHAARDYLETMSAELSELAYKNGLDSLAVIFDMAREEAKRLRRDPDEDLGGS